MATARQSHSATLLSDGRVLVAGGASDLAGTSAIASAELFDPLAAQWAPAGSLAVARWGHASALLLDGRVLVAGGSASSALSSAEVFEPRSGTWAALPAMRQARHEGVAVRLADGRILVTGGAAAASAEIYDPKSNRWALTATMSRPRAAHTASLLPNGRVLVVGGLDNSQATVATPELFDPATGRWSTLPAMPEPRYRHAATALADGRVVVAGGFAQASPPSLAATTQVYDPVASTWTSGGALATRRWQASMNLLPSGRLLIAGGRDQTGAALGSAELFDPSTETWSAAGPLPNLRGQHTATMIGFGRVLLCGGSSTAVLASADVYDTATPVLSAGPPMPTARGAHVVELLPTGKVLVAGGGTSGTQAAQDLLLDPVTNVWTAIPRSVGSHFFAKWSLLHDGRVLVTLGNLSIDADLFDPFTETWAVAAAPNEDRRYHIQVTLRNGKVLVAGGGSLGALTVGKSTAELYDPATDTWRPTGSLPGPRVYARPVLLPDGRVVAVGGATAIQSGPSLFDAAIYDPVSETWTLSAPASHQLANHTATLLRDGRILVAGGLYDFTDALLFDPANNRWTSVGRLNEGRQHHTATLLGNGTVFVTSGRRATFTDYALTAEVYNPATQSWTTVGNITEPRDNGLGSVWLPDGRVFTIGGFIDASNATASVDVFEPGLVPAPTLQPTLGSPLLQTPAGGTLRFSGTLLTSASEGATGSYLGSAANFPLLLFRASSERETYGRVSNWSAIQGSVEIPASLTPGWHWVTPIVNGTPGDSRPIQVAPRELGMACGTRVDCASGFCAQGVCCNTACDEGGCKVCSVAAGARVDGTCGLLAKDQPCRIPAGPCDRAELCDGRSVICPDDRFWPPGYGGSPACSAPLECTGVTIRCGCGGDSECLGSASCVASRCIPHADAFDSARPAGCGTPAGAVAFGVLALWQLTLRRRSR